MSAIITGFAVIFRRCSSGRHIGIGAEFIVTFGDFVLDFFACEFINHPCGLFVKLDISQGISFAINDGVSFAGNATMFFSKSQLPSKSVIYKKESEKIKSSFKFFTISR